MVIAVPLYVTPERLPVVVETTISDAPDAQVWFQDLGLDPPAALLTVSYAIAIPHLYDDLMCDRIGSMLVDDDVFSHKIVA